MKAKLRFYKKEQIGKNTVVEIKVWEVKRDIHYPNGFKYSFVLIRKNKRVLGYDNYERKGHHKHIGDSEYKYEFKSLQKLIEDFEKDVAKLIK